MDRPTAAWSRPVASRSSLRDRWLGWRDRLLANPTFQWRAAAFPLTRGIAARRAGDLFDLCAGFVYSQVLLACVRLEVFHMLADGPRSVEWLANRTRLDVSAATCLLDAAVSLGLLERRGPGRYGLGQLGAALLGNPGVGAMIEHHELLYADLADPVALLRGEKPPGRLAGYWPYAGASRPESLTPGQVEDYTRLMSASQPLVAHDVIDAYPFASHRCLLDVGGGNGTFVAALADRARGLQLQLFDLPGVLEHARRHLASLGLADRVMCVGGSFLSDPLPVGADIVSLVRVLHDHDDAAAQAILRACAAALPDGGTIVVGEPLAGTPGAEAMGDAYFGFYLRAMGSGRPRTARQVGELLRVAGFTSVQEIRTARPMLVGVVTARRQRPRGL